MRSLLSMIALLAGLIAAPAGAADKLTIAGSDWCPYNCASGAAKPGYMIEVARAVFGEAGVDYTLLNWARTIEETKAGAYDGLVGSSKRDGFLFTSQPLGIAQNGFAVRKGQAFAYAGPESLAGKVLGVIRDYSYTDQLDAYIAANGKDDAKVQLTSGDDALTLNLKKLDAGRVDLVVDDVNVLSAAIRQLGLEGKLEVMSAGAPDPVYIAFTAAKPGSAERVRALDEGIAKLRESGRLKAILDGYGLKDWQ